MKNNKMDIQIYKKIKYNYQQIKTNKKINWLWKIKKIIILLNYNKFNKM